MRCCRHSRLYLRRKPNKAHITRVNYYEITASPIIRLLDRLIEYLFKIPIRYLNVEERLDI